MRDCVAPWLDCSIKKTAINENCHRVPICICPIFYCLENGLKMISLNQIPSALHFKAFATKMFSEIYFTIHYKIPALIFYTQDFLKSDYLLFINGDSFSKNITLFIWEADLQRDMKRQKASICLFISQITMALPNQSPEPGTLSWSPTWIAKFPLCVLPVI